MLFVLLTVFSGLLFLIVRYICKAMSMLYAMENLSMEDITVLLQKSRRDPFFDSIFTILSRYNQQYSQRKESELLSERSHFLALQQQINPHFLYNTLESIRGEALLVNAPHIAEMTKRLSSLFRYSISSERALVSVYEELENVQNYMAIQNYRFSDRLSLKLNIEDDFCLNCMIPKLTLQPLVENSIYHGLEIISRKGEITIKVTATQKKIIITVSDNGTGIAPDRLAKVNASLREPSVAVSSTRPDAKPTTGIALANINKRIKLQYGEEYGIILRSVQNFGTDVEIFLPRVEEHRG